MRKTHSIIYLAAFSLIFSPVSRAEDSSQPAATNPNNSAGASTPPKRQNSFYAKSSKPDEAKYGQASIPIKSFQSSMKDAQGTLQDSEMLDFQQRFDDLQSKAAQDVAHNGPFASLYVNELKRLQEELAANIERTKQSNASNLAALQSAISHLKSTYSDRKASMSKSEQNQFETDIRDLSSRAEAIVPSNDTAIRMNSLIEEAGSIEANIAGRSILPGHNRGADRPVAPNQGSQPSTIPDEPSDEEYFATPNTGNFFPEKPKPAVDEVLNSLAREVESCSKHGLIGTFEQEAIEEKLKAINESWAKIRSSAAPGSPQEVGIRKRLEELEKEFAKSRSH